MNITRRKALGLIPAGVAAVAAPCDFAAARNSNMTFSKLGVHAIRTTYGTIVTVIGAGGSGGGQLHSKDKPA